MEGALGMAAVATSKPGNCTRRVSSEGSHLPRKGLRRMGAVTSTCFSFACDDLLSLDARYLPRNDEDEQTTTRVEGVESIAAEANVRQALVACAEARAAGMTVRCSCIKSVRLVYVLY